MPGCKDIALGPRAEERCRCGQGAWETFKDINVTDHKDAYRARAEAQFKKPDTGGAAPGKAAYDAESAAREENTERLKRLRLAREESAREAVAINKARRTLRTKSR